MAASQNLVRTISIRTTASAFFNTGMIARLMFPVKRDFPSFQGV
jgi:hypothetical protein